MSLNTRVIYHTLHAHAHTRTHKTGQIEQNLFKRAVYQDLVKQKRVFFCNDMILISTILFKFLEHLCHKLLPPMEGACRFGSS